MRVIKTDPPHPTPSVERVKEVKGHFLWERHVLPTGTYKDGAALVSCLLAIRPHLKLDWSCAFILCLGPFQAHHFPLILHGKSKVLDQEIRSCESTVLHGIIYSRVFVNSRSSTQLVQHVAWDGTAAPQRRSILFQALAENA